MTDINLKVELWKNKLLDMGKRNRLLNYRDTRKSSLRILNPTIYDLWDSFVIHEHELQFPFIDDTQLSLSEFEDENGSAHHDIGLMTNLPLKEQQRVLRNLRSKAKTISEEQGVNTLYLSFGFLRWSESDNSKQYFDSPLILVPVTLSWESISSPFVLSLHEDEIVLNPTLLYKLDNDFGIKLPDLNIDRSLESFFDEVEQIVSVSGWNVIREVGLSLLSFLKINMYRDLEKHRETIANNPVVRALCGDSSAIEHDLSFLKDFDYDSEIMPEHSFSVVDADSSQMDAILCAKKGISFVLQGPPGTGKSQTITNIIAESLADGKKVLFVSEKRAALDVVYKRLAEANLSDFCLTLHSHKANKKDTLCQLGNVLALASKKAAFSDEAYQKLSRLADDRKRLNDYAQAIYTVISPLNKTIYEVAGRLAELQDYDDLIFAIPDVRKTDTQKYADYINSLTRFSDTIDSLTGDFRTNPWREANVDFVSNELRHDINSHLGSAIPKAKQLIDLSDILQRDLAFNITVTYSNIKKLINLLDVASRSPKVPIDWILGFDLSMLASEISTYEQISERFEVLKSQLDGFQVQVESLDPSADFPINSTLTSSEKIDEYLQKIQAFVSANCPYNVWNSVADWNRASALCASAQEHIDTYNELRGQIQEKFEKDIFSIEYNQMYIRFKSEYSSAFKVFNSNYRKDKRLVQGLALTPGQKFDDKEILELLVNLRKLESEKAWMDENAKELTKFFGNMYAKEKTDFSIIERAMSAYQAISNCKTTAQHIRELLALYDSSEQKLTEHFGNLYQGIGTDWREMKKYVEWAKEFKIKLEDLELKSSKFAGLVCSSEEIIKLCKEYKFKIENTLKEFDADFRWYLTLFQSPEEFCIMGLPALKDRMEACVNNLAALEEWIDFRTIRSKCCELGLESFLNAIESNNISPDRIIPVFQKRFYRLWLDSVFPDFPVVANFRHQSQENIIKEFSELDRLQFQIARLRIRTKLINSLPDIEHFASGVDEISVLKRELGKQKRIMPIRLLFKKIPNLLLTLKPCLMMSPLSVSLFLESDAYQFDTVIFDEASQVCTENAIGAIIRGKQVIIAGDSKQLPPTNFFAAAVSDKDFDIDTDDEDEYDDSSAYESILDEAALLPPLTLLWHYRSRHEHLIAFSNAKIYHNELVTFPSTVDRLPDVGVEYIYVKDGFYDRGGRKGNVIEAKKVAEMVFEHFKRFPNRSLGVIAFGEVQELAIDTALRELRMKNQQFEQFFKEDKHEPFFIKSLENVQGDERDTIIFSIGYAKDSTGVMRMQFGPLSQSGGERRLNVAITRAKYNVKLVGSILPTDIITEKISADGPKLLRSYIDFAINGPEVLRNDISTSEVIEHDSPFEEAVYRFLDKKGYRVATQVGCSGYRIDMAVKHPKLDGRYVLGIECDGATYHSSRTARERDRLRQDVLEGMGWKIYRIWSTDWLKDPISEGQRLVEAVEQAIDSYIDVSLSKVEDSAPKEERADEFLTLEEKGTSAQSEANPYGFSKPALTDYRAILRNRNRYLSLSDCIELIVKNEYPIHYDLLCQKLCPLMKREKVSSTVRNEVNYALSSMTGRVVKKDDFLYPAKYDSIPAYGANGRAIKYISTDELASAMLKVAGKCIGATRTSLIEETTRAYGFNRKGSNISIAMEAAYDQLLKAHKLYEVEGKVVLNRRT